MVSKFKSVSFYGEPGLSYKEFETSALNDLKNDLEHCNVKSVQYMVYWYPGVHFALYDEPMPSYWQSFPMATMLNFIF